MLVEKMSPEEYEKHVEYCEDILSNYGYELDKDYDLDNLSVWEINSISATELFIINIWKTWKHEPDDQYVLYGGEEFPDSVHTDTQGWNISFSIDGGYDTYEPEPMEEEPEDYEPLERQF